MRRRLFFLCAVSMFLLPPGIEAAAAHNLKPGEAFVMAGQQENLYLLDVRTPWEYRQVRLQGAHLIPIDQLARRIDELPRDRPILVYCAVGSRSAQVVNYLARHGFSALYNLDGGIYAWAQLGLPILQGEP